MRFFKTEAKTSILVAVLLVLVVASLRPGKEVSGDAALQQHSPILIDGNSAFTGPTEFYAGLGRRRTLSSSGIGRSMPVLLGAESPWSTRPVTLSYLASMYSPH